MEEVVPTYHAAIDPKSHATVVPFLTMPSVENSSITSAKLTISGVGANITIKEGNTGMPYKGGYISSAGSFETIHLPKGQVLYVNLSGTGVVLKIARSIAPQVQVNNSGVGSSVSIY